MSQKYPGGFITKTPTAPTSSAAPGIWTLDQAMQNQKAGNWPSPPSPYIEDYFSTWLYTGNGSTQTITNGIDLSTEGGLVWLKNRDGVPANQNHNLVDTLRGINKPIYTNSAGAQLTQNTIASFDTTGFTLGGFGPNGGGATYASWTFRKQPKFFTQGTYSGNGSTQAITHDLGSAPGCVIVKNITTSGSWIVWHRGLSSGYYIQLNGTGAQDNLNATRRFGNNSATVDPTSTTITVGDLINTSGDTWVYYAFAHDAGGFGLTGSDNVISCGSASATGVTAVSLGYEPQFCMLKKSSGIGGWFMTDTMRGWNMQGDVDVRANVADAETDRTGSGWFPSATGFTFDSAQLNGSGDYIYIAIRRGPMKVPTSGTEVFSAVATSGTGTNNRVITGLGFSPDLILNCTRGSSALDRYTQDRLRGLTQTIYTNTSGAEQTGQGIYAVGTLNMSGFTLGTSSGVGFNSASDTYVFECFKRAPSFFDEVCYTGTAPTAQNLTHNLGVAPEFIIIKRRDAGGSWFTGSMFTSTTVTRAVLNSNSDQDLNNLYSGQSIWGGQPTSSVFSVGTGSGANASGGTYVAYLFATCAGVSKVGSYTGTGTTLQVNCGFTAGARFVLIKRVNTTGDWYIWDSARGIVSGNDPYLLLNSTAAEVTNTDYVDTYSAGFEISSTAPAAINASAGTFIFLAIA